MVFSVAHDDTNDRVRCVEGMVYLQGAGMLYLRYDGSEVTEVCAIVFSHPQQTELPPFPALFILVIRVKYDGHGMMANSRIDWWAP